jgi:hypothetical protein
MPETALMVPSNLSHNVPAIIETVKHSLTNLAKLYLVTEVAGQSQATLDAERRDLHRFLHRLHISMAFLSQTAAPNSSASPPAFWKVSVFSGKDAAFSSAIAGLRRVVSRLNSMRPSTPPASTYSSDTHGVLRPGEPFQDILWHRLADTMAISPACAA